MDYPAVVCALLGVCIDAVFMHFLHRISRCIPAPNQVQSDAASRARFAPQYAGCLDKFITLSYPSYFYRPSENTDADNINVNLNPVGSPNSDRYYLSNKMIRCNQAIIVKLMNLWQVACGLLFMVLQIAFMLNMMFQFLVACYQDQSKWLLAIGIPVTLCIFHVFRWLLTKSWNATLLLWHNVSNEFDTNIQWYWCIAHIALWCFYIIVAAAMEQGNFDRGFWPTILYYMILRGMIWISLYTLVVIGVDLYVLVGIVRELNTASYLSHSLLADHGAQRREPHKEDDAADNTKFTELATYTEEEKKSEMKEEEEEDEEDEAHEAQQASYSLFDHKAEDLSYLSWQFVIFGVTAADSKVVRRIKYSLFALFIVAIILLFAIPSSKSRALRFAGSMLLFFYFIVAVLDKVDFNALYCVWSGRYHQRSWKLLRKFWNQRDIQVFPANVLTLKYQDLWCLYVKHRYLYWWAFKFPTFTVDDTDRVLRCKCANTKCFWYAAIVCRLFIILLIIVTPFIFYVSKIAETLQHPNYYNKMVDWSRANQSSPYPLCESLNINGIDTLDLAFLTSAIYYPSDLPKQLSTWFDSNVDANGAASNWTEIYTYDDANEYTSTYAHIGNAERNTEIILVRGTNGQDDAIQDLSLWSEIGFVQVVSWVIPLTIMTSTDFLRNYVYFASIPEGLIEPSWKHRYYDAVYQYVRTNLSEALRDEDRTIIILGHSLGGGIAQIVAAKLLLNEEANQVLSFGVASPGTKYSSKKFGFDVNSLHETSISVLPERDLVSQIDVHGGEIQIIKCDGEHALDCHSVETHFCEISENCESALDNKRTARREFIECVCGTKTKDPKEWTKCY